LTPAALGPLRPSVILVAMPHISYADPATLDDPELVGYIEDARLRGTPRPESQSIRAHAPATLRCFSRSWERIFRRGVVDHSLKELCRVYVSQTIGCDY
jgi:hypothetical protein